MDNRVKINLPYASGTGKFTCHIIVIVVSVNRKL